VTGAAARSYGEAMETTREYRTGSDSRTLRDALGCFATGVTVVTCLDGAGNPVGLTANSFTSVSLDPPLLLVCVAKVAASLEALTNAPHFAVNVLQTGQEPESITFSTRTEDRFGRTRWALGEHGVPLLEGSLSVFECARSAVHDGGDHIILVGEVKRATFDPALDPLLYFRGRYRRLHFD
jgi:flavin reductase (DIM6/NTAB) family NADH-FMN oxidoreductase RutF